jgi:hypothetical protein
VKVEYLFLIQNIFFVGNYSLDVHLNEQIGHVPKIFLFGKTKKKHSLMAAKWRLYLLGFFGFFPWTYGTNIQILETRKKYF